MSNLRAGVGRSELTDSFDAGSRATAQAMGEEAGPPGALIVFASPQYDFRDLLAGIVSVAGEVPMVGGTTAGEIWTGGFSTQSVVVMALRADELTFTSGLGANMSDDEAACGRALARMLASKADMGNALSLLVFPNGLGGDGVRVLEGLHGELGSEFEVVGGYLGDDERFENTFQFYDGKVYRDAMPGLMISGVDGYRTGIGVRSGFDSIGVRFKCTEAEGNVVKKFDGEDALALYKQFLGEERAEKLPGVCLEYPFGLIDDKVSISGTEYFQLRCGLAVNQEEGTISLAAAIPEGSSITLTTASRGEIINGARLAAEQARESLQGADPGAILMFSCVGRKLVLGRRTQEEVEAVQEVLGADVPLIGFYTYGEIGPISKMEKELALSKFHNETVVLWVLGQA
jgi:hypothetical protein